MQKFDEMLRGGHRNSLGNTVAVVELILENRQRIQELYHCYFSDDDVVRLRTSNALKRIGKEHIELLIPFINGFLNEIPAISQASTQWTLASLYDMLRPHMSSAEQTQAKRVMQRNLTSWDDWIVLTTTMKVLVNWARSDRKLAQWLVPRLKKHQLDERKSVAGRAGKLLIAVEKELKKI